MRSSLPISRLRASLAPFRLSYFSAVRSTNDHAAALRSRGKLFAPAIVLTSRQMRGRGRGANGWWSNDGSLTQTFVLPIEDHLKPHQVPLVAGIAIREAIESITGSTEIKLKWPNDILFDDRKIAGLLCERIDRVDLIGVGLNVNVAAKQFPVALRDRATSLSQIVGQSLDRADVLIALAKSIRDRLLEPREYHFAEMLREYDRHHALLGRRVEVQIAAPGGGTSRVAGECIGLDDVGRLLLRDGRTLHRIIAGHVTMR